MSDATGTGFMTAEERVKGLDLTGNKWLRERIASAIRAAENDALDRAARRVADEMGWGLDARWVADLIRSLKSKEPA